MEALIDEIPNSHSPRFDAISTISNSSCSQLIKLTVYYLFTREKLPVSDNGKLPFKLS